MAAYDGTPTYDTVAAHGDDIVVIIPPHVTAVLSEDAGHNPSQRDKHIASIAAHGRLGWQKESGYGRRALVETAMGRYKAIIRPRTACAWPVWPTRRKRPSVWPCSTVCLTPDGPTPSADCTKLLEVAWGMGSFARVISMHQRHPNVEGKASLTRATARPPWFRLTRKRSRRRW